VEAAEVIESMAFPQRLHPAADGSPTPTSVGRDVWEPELSHAMSSFSHQREELRKTLRRRGIGDERVLRAIGAVPRERFVAPELIGQAYDDTALPHAAGQTISQPFVVALMTQLLRLSGDESVLEIGTGSGYQTAVLSLLARRVVTVERLPELAAPARQILAEMGLTNIEFHTGDGTLGWPESAPYDAILVTAGAPEVPAPLLAQLVPGGRLVIPVGDAEQQELTLVTKHEAGPEMIQAGPCRFVRLIGAAGWDVAE
jgi:protein-L-isoaspartate(D-aspartate) O-methyltransferase